MVSINNKKPKLAIGLVVYNGEKYLSKALNSLLNQTFEDFQIIISDNASTDKTSTLCQEISKKDNRIKYIRHQKNMGATKNFIFTLQKAETEYFMWAAADDYWEPQFIEKNFEILETNKKIIGSISDVEFVGENIPEMYKSNQKGTTYEYLIKHLPPLSASLSEKVSFHLKHNRGMSTYSIFRTEILKMCIIERDLCGWDQTLVLNTLKHGDLHIIDEILMHRTAEGETSIPSQITRWKNHGISNSEIIFLGVPFTIFFMKHFGLKIFFKNFNFLLKFNYRIERSVCVDFLRKIKSRLT
jgi:glycosyltransferase involved in cell wall biosynthesis